MSLVVNGTPAHSMRWHAGWSGAWSSELSYDSEIPLSGKAVIVSTEGIFANGTIDAALSGTFGEKKHVRVVGGLGWSKPVRAQHYHTDVGVNLAVLATTTAAEAGEVATVLIPKVLGVDFVRRAGPAGQIFEDAGVDWWVGLDGITRVGLRVPTPPHPSLTVLDWNPAEGTVGFTCEILPEPGTILVDIRFGTRIVREVDAMVSGGSVSGTLWIAEAPPGIGESTNGLADAIGALARAATRADYSRFYEYVVIAMAGDRVELKAISHADGMPDVLPASVWAGASGYRATLTPGSRALVGFRGGDPARPFVAFYEPPDLDVWRPLVLDLDALAALNIGATATAVVIGGPGGMPIARVTPTFAAWIAAVTVAINALAPGSAIAPIDVASLKAVSS